MFIHQYLNPDNILMLKLKSGDKNMKIRGLEIGIRLCDRDTSQPDDTGFVAKEWMAPEIQKIKMKYDCSSTSAQNLGTSTDVFSVGCIFHYVITNGKHPFGNNQLEILNNIADKYQKCICLSKFDIQHLGSVRLIQQMIAKDPEDRPPVSAVLEHHLFWSRKKCLEFLISAAKLLETDAAKADDIVRQCLREANMNYSKWLYNKWPACLSSNVITELRNIQDRKSLYDVSSIIGLLRAIKDLHNHYTTLPVNARRELENFTDYWIQRFPFLVDNVWTNLQKLKSKPELTGYYAKDYMFFRKSINLEEQRVFDEFIVARVLKYRLQQVNDEYLLPTLDTSW